MKRFFRTEDGYALVLTLLFMPALIGMSMLVIDIGRGNNAHSDLYAAADALALAGARELDGGTDAIDRAKEAMDNFSNSVSFLGRSGTDTHITLTYSDGGTVFTVVFLENIPDSDDDPIDATYLAENSTDLGEDADYIYVRAQARNLATIFMTPFSSGPESVPVGAVAVATYLSAACNVTPLYICNPFEAQNVDLQDAFNQGQLHGRLIRLHPKGSDTAQPGNFGFLQVTGNNDNSTASANAIRQIFAGGQNPTCYNSKAVTTKPGAATSIAAGLNIRFDIYEAPFSNSAATYPPAVNVRKGFIRSATGSNNACNVELTSNLAWTMPFPPNDVMAPPGAGAAGAAIGSGNWDVNAYWAVNHPTRAPLTQAQLDAMSSFPSAAFPGAAGPSRYDMYRYEIAQGIMGDLSVGDSLTTPTAGTRESGLPNCGLSKPSPAVPVDDPDRRLMFAAIIDCNANGGHGVIDFPVNSYASIFMANPMFKVAGEDSTIDVEIVDITGYGGNGSLELFLREEAVLVR